VILIGDTVRARSQRGSKYREHISSPRLIRSFRQRESTVEAVTLPAARIEFAHIFVGLVSLVFTVPAIVIALYTLRDQQAINKDQQALNDLERARV
jgi:hypothetical protein